MWFGIGLLVGALLAGGTAATVGVLIQALLPVWPRVVLATGVAVAVAARELRLVSFPIPENRRLVPETVLRRGPIAGAFQFGTEMGTGMRTYSPSALPHLMLVMIVLVLPFGWGMAAAIGFAVGRWVTALAASRFPAGPTAWAARWARYSRLVVGMLAVVVAGFVATALLEAVS